MWCGDSFALPNRTKVKRISQEVDDTFGLPFDEIAPDIPEAYIVDAQGKPLHPSYAAYILINSELWIHQVEDVRLSKVIRSNVD